MVTSLVSIPPGLPADPFLLAALLDMLPMGVIYYTPVVDAVGTLTDLALAYLNPTAQRMTQLPAQPGTTYRQQFPTTDDNGAWAFHHRSWLAQEPQQFQFYYDADGFDSYFRVTAQRIGEGLLVVFTDTQDETRSEVEEALRESQARERAALARAEATQREAEATHADLANVFTQAPAMICIFEGPAHTFQFVNPPYQALVGKRPLLGKPIAEAMPELAGQPIFGLLDHVYQTGETFAAAEMLVQLDHDNEGRAELEKRYYNFIYKARHNRQGVIDGILVFAYEVTPQVLIRQQVQTLNEELASINEELRATNEEYQYANLALSESQRQLRQLTQELEARVQARTQETQEARLLAEVRQQRLEQLVLQAPAAICILDGPELVYELVNPAYQQLFPGRALRGLPLLEALPELRDQPVWYTLQQVYRTGRTHLELGIRIPVARTQGGPLEDFYFNYIQQARVNAEGQVDGVIVFAFEVSEQVLARQQVQRLNEELTVTNAELNESNSRLTRTNVDLDNFIYTASHDLKAPITNIEGLLLALEHELPPAGRTGDVPLMLGMMLGAIDRFRRTIAHLTDLSRLQKEYAHDGEVVALAPVVEAVRLDLTPLLGHTQGYLTVFIPEDLTVTFAEKNLRSVVYNLLSNAFKYHHPDRRPEVQLRSWLSDDYAVLEVQDNGLGLDLAQGQERLFAMFQRLHTHVEGTGVGLYMVKRILENAGGRIEVSSQLGQGSTFQVYFRR